VKNDFLQTVKLFTDALQGTEMKLARAYVLYAEEGDQMPHMGPDLLLSQDE